jgi:methylated-DNA-[protein]-cysteine S-methyltransferase
MPDRPFCLFDTALGRCGVAWSEHGLTRVALPHADDAALRAHLAPAVEAPPPPKVAAAIAQITAHVAGRPGALETIELDMTGLSAFHAELYAVARSIPSGQTVTYGALAIRLGKPGAARAVGQAMGKNPFPIVVPCHRVLAAHHGTGGFSAPGGVVTKAKLLAAEGFILALQPDLPF